MSPLDIYKATDLDFDGWLRAHGGIEREIVIEIYNKASGKQPVSLVAIQDMALCHGWVDTQTKKIGDRGMTSASSRNFLARTGPRRTADGVSMADGGS